MVVFRAGNKTETELNRTSIVTEPDYPNLPCLWRELASMIYVRLMVNFEVTWTLYDFNTFFLFNKTKLTLSSVVYMQCWSARELT